jgi:hypothetical protein
VEQTMVTLIIAAEYRLYKMYLRANGLSERKCRFVNDEEKLRGYNHDTPVIVVTPSTAHVRDLEMTARYDYRFSNVAVRSV